MSKDCNSRITTSDLNFNYANWFSPNKMNTIFYFVIFCLSFFMNYSIHIMIRSWSLFTSLTLLVFGFFKKPIRTRTRTWIRYIKVLTTIEILHVLQNHSKWRVIYYYIYYLQSQAGLECRLFFPEVWTYGQC